MEKIKAIQNTAKLCWKCLKEKEPLHIIKFGPLGYGSGFDNCQTKIQLCEECFQKSNPDIWSEEIVYDSEEAREYGFAHYIHEDEIFAYFDSLPIEGRQFVWNEFHDDGYQMDPQDWIDYQIGILPHEVAKKYGLYSTQEIDAYKEQFPKCRWPVNRIFDDGSKGCWCPFGAHGEYGQKAGRNISEECYQCEHYAKRDENDPIKDIPDHEFSDYQILTQADAIRYKWNERRPLELILFTSYGGGFLPKELKQAADKNPEGRFKYRSGKVVEKLKEMAYEVESLSGYTEEMLKKLIDKHVVVHEKGRGVYYYIESDGYLNMIKKMVIENVDTSRNWVLDEYDGSEAIRYIELEDDKTGFCKFVS